MTAEQLNEILALVTAYGLKVAGGIVLLIAGWMVSRWGGKATQQVLTRSRRVDATLTGFLASLVRYLILAVVLIAVLNQFGVQTASLIAVLGAAGLAVGLALQGTLANLAAGVMLLFFRPIKVGQYVQTAGQAGTVQDINLFMTELATPDNVQILLPNSAVWGNAVVNYSHHPTRRLDMVLNIAYSDDLDRAMRVVREVIAADSRPLAEPTPEVMVSNLGESAVDITTRIWVHADDYWPLKFDLTKAFKQTFDAHGITIPFPQREMHIVQAGQGAGSPLS